MGWNWRWPRPSEKTTICHALKRGAPLRHGRTSASFLLLDSPSPNSPLLVPRCDARLLSFLCCASKRNFCSKPPLLTLSRTPFPAGGSLSLSLSQSRFRNNHGSLRSYAGIQSLPHCTALHSRQSSSSCPISIRVLIAHLTCCHPEMVWAVVPIDVSILVHKPC